MEKVISVNTNTTFRYKRLTETKTNTVAFKKKTEINDDRFIKGVYKFKNKMTGFTSPRGAYSRCIGETGPFVTFVVAQKMPTLLIIATIVVRLG